MTTKCFQSIPEVIGSQRYDSEDDVKFYYHFLSDDKHCMMSEMEFNSYVARRGYIFLYNCDLPIINSEALNGWKDELVSHEKEFMHVNRSFNQPRSAKPTRKLTASMQATLDFTNKNIERAEPKEGKDQKGNNGSLDLH